MWFKYFNKDFLKLRMWRNYNLRNQFNEHGTHSFLNTSAYKQAYSRVWGAEGPQRLFNILMAISFVGMYSYVDNKNNAVKREKEQKEKEILLKKSDLERMKNYYTNRFGVATNPGESMDKFIDFISNGEAITKLGNFNSNKYTSKISEDVINGLDAAIGEEDKKIMEYEEYYAKDHHQFYFFIQQYAHTDGIIFYLTQHMKLILAFILIMRNHCMKSITLQYQFREEVWVVVFLEVEVNFIISKQFILFFQLKVKI